MSVTRRSFSRIEYDTIAGTMIATKPDGTTEMTIGGAPGGSTTQGQFNISGAFAGFSAFFWDATNSCPSVLLRLGFKNGTSVGAMVWNPTAARVWTIPDATDTAVGRATTDTLSGKTMLLDANTFSASGAAVGDCVVHDGTRFVHLAKGANGTFLGVSGGVVGFYSPGGGGSPGGTSGEIQWNSAGSFTGTTHWSTDGSGMIADASGYLEMGSTSPATSGWVRVQAAAADVVVLRVSSTDVPIISHDGSGFVYIGGNVAGTHACNNLQLEAVTDVRIGTLTALGMKVTTTDVEYSLPRHGNATPYSSEGQMTLALSGTAQTLSSGQYSRSVWKFTGPNSNTDTITIPAPADEDHSYVKQVRMTSTNTVLVFSTGTGATAAIGPAGASNEIRGTLFVTPDGCFFHGVGNTGFTAAAVA